MARVGSEMLGERALPRLTWGAVIAGVLLALASHIVLGLLGAALGFAAQPADSNAVGAGAAIWALLTPFVATLVGAWVACRMAAAPRLFKLISVRAVAGELGNSRIR